MLRFVARRGGEAVAEMAVTPTLRRVLEVIRATLDPGYVPLAAALAELGRCRGGRFPRAHARFQRFAARAHGDVHPTFGLPADRAVVYADVATISSSNLSLRLSPAGYEIACPGSVSNRLESEQIRLGDLDVVHDPAAGALRLVWRSHAAQVVPLHLGTLVDWALPWTYRLLMQTFSVSTFCGLPQRLSGLTFLTQDQGARRIPRLCLGDVVVERATYFPPTRSP